MKNKFLAGPYLVWMLIFTLVPLAIVVYYAFTDSVTGAFTLANLGRMGTYLPIFLRSIGLAAIASLICLIIGYPVAYCIASASEKWQKLLSMLVVLPMCMSFLLRTLAWVSLLDDTGIINQLLGHLGIGPLPLVRNNAAVILGMVYNYLPYMITPLYTVIMKIDPAAEYPRHRIRHYHGLCTRCLYLLYLSEAGRHRHGSHWRCGRKPVQDCIQSQSGRSSEPCADGDGAHLHRHYEPLLRW